MLVSNTLFRKRSGFYHGYLCIFSVNRIFLPQINGILLEWGRARLIRKQVWCLVLPNEDCLKSQWPAWFPFVIIPWPACGTLEETCWSSQNLKSNILNKQRGVHFIQRQDLIINHRAMYIFCKHIISLRASRTWNHFHSMHNMWFVLVWPARINSSHTVKLL